MKLHYNLCDNQTQVRRKKQPAGFEKKGYIPAKKDTVLVNRKPLNHMQWMMIFSYRWWPVGSWIFRHRWFIVCQLWMHDWPIRQSLSRLTTKRSNARLRKVSDEQQQPQFVSLRRAHKHTFGHNGQLTNTFHLHICLIHRSIQSLASQKRHLFICCDDRRRRKLSKQFAISRAYQTFLLQDDVHCRTHSFCLSKTSRRGLGVDNFFRWWWWLSTS